MVFDFLWDIDFLRVRIYLFSFDNLHCFLAWLSLKVVIPFLFKELFQIQLTSTFFGALFIARIAYLKCPVLGSKSFQIDIFEFFVLQG